MNEYTIMFEHGLYTVLRKTPGNLPYEAAKVPTLEQALQFIYLASGRPVLIPVNVFQTW